MPPRSRRRAVGPAGSPPPEGPEPRLDEPAREQPTDDDERFRTERPPHHDRER